jgi:hypothetical protein
VQCTQTSFDQRLGVLPLGFHPSSSQPLTVAYLDVNGYREIAARLLADFVNKERSNPSNCSSEFASVVAAPTLNQHFLGTPIALNVQRAAGCSPAVDGVQPLFQLEWQHLDPNTAQFSDASVVPTFDGTANPTGTNVPQALFKPADGTNTFNVWQVRAKLMNTPQDAPWSDFVTFIVVPSPAG